MRKKSSRRKQKMHNMRGCSRTRKHLLGGDAYLAYTGKPIFSIPNPNLAYTGKGGSSCGLSSPSTPPSNINGVNSAYPSTGPPFKQEGNIFNNSAKQNGGCGCGLPMMTGGKKRKGGCGPLCSMGFMVGGVRHRAGCKCSKCKKKTMIGGNAGVPYANGLVGDSFTPGKIDGWPGVDGIPGNHNHFEVNSYNNDISRQMIDVGANPPFLKGGKQKQKGGTLSNFMAQDLINLGRQFQFGVGSAYNALAGYSAPVNPLPWKDQFPSRTPFNPAII